MVTTLLAGLALLQLPGDREIQVTEITRDKVKGSTSMLRVEVQPIEPSRQSPKLFGNPPRPWEFPWIVQGYVRSPGVNQFNLRFRVYSQERKAKGDRAPAVTRMLTALWEELNRANLEHRRSYNGGIIDVFLCWGGKAGGEQRFDVTTEGGQQKHVNTIYFYDLDSFDKPIEMAREVAHEYGHAVLPAMGIYEAPEDWANGYLGEKVFLRFLLQSIEADRASDADVMGVSAAELRGWVAKNVEPLLVTAAQALPTPELLAGATAKDMNEYLGLTLYASAILPRPVFGRSLVLSESTDPKSYPEGIALAAEEPEELVLQVPKSLAGKAIWVPINKGRLTGGKVLRIVGKWAKVQPTAAELTVINRRP